MSWLCSVSNCVSFVPFLPRGGKTSRRHWTTIQRWRFTHFNCKCFHRDFFSRNALESPTGASICLLLSMKTCNLSDRRQRGPHVLPATAAGYGQPRGVHCLLGIDGADGNASPVCTPWNGEIYMVDPGQLSHFTFRLCLDSKRIVRSVGYDSDLISKVSDECNLKCFFEYNSIP